MTPQERQLVRDLFDRLASLEGDRRDAEAERSIAEGLMRAPNATYALVQTVLVQDEALKRADARIRELEATRVGNARQEEGGFLGNMRDALFGSREDRRGSVPSVPPAGAPMGVPPGFRTGTNASSESPPNSPSQMEPSERGRGGSFLGTAAAAAAGVVGGALLLDGVRSILGHPQGAQAHGALDSAPRSPWGKENSGGDLAQEAGLGDIGRGTGDDRAPDRHAGLFDSSYDDTNSEFIDEDEFDIDSDADLT